MKKLSYITVPNPLKERGTAVYDYIGQFVTNGTTDLNAFCKKIATGRPNIDAPLVKLVLQTAFATIANGIAEENVRYNLDGISFETAISGSVPSVDGALTDENKLYVLISVGNPIRAAVAKLVAENADASVAAVRIFAVEDAASHEVGVVHGTATAVITGKNISASQPGESVALVDPLTRTAASAGTVVAQDGMGQRIDVNFAAPFEAGEYDLVLTTRGYATPDAEPNAYSKKVKATAATPPGPVLPVESADHVVKITSCPAFSTAGVSDPVGGQNLGFDDPLGRGIDKATCTIDGTNLEWTNNARSGIAATSAQFGFASGQELPPAGAYLTTLKFVRITDSGEEILSVVNATVNVTV